jgi:CRISPR-associated endonuclease/helicase Cas3
MNTPNVPKEARRATPQLWLRLRRAVVNRRTVVDQATEIVLGIRHRLLEPDHDDWPGYAEALRETATALRSLCASEGDPLAVSTLRGELADNEEWKSDPSRPAIIIGTIDMIGSKLLFNGYGDRRYGRTHHAGLIGQDALIVHDEAHLTPAFSDLLRTLEQEQNRESQRRGDTKSMVRPMRTIELSATSRGSVGDAFELEPEDEGDEIVQERLDAQKLLRLHETETAGIVEKLADLGKAHEERSAKVLIYVRSPEDAQRVASALTRALAGGTDDRIALLTGTIRGHERDQLVKTNRVYRALLDHESKVERTVYLVSTSAGEVGIDLDADHMACDLATLDALIQRLGRVNRRGGKKRVADVDVVVQADQGEITGSASDVEKAMAATLALLRRWDGPSSAGIDVSPRNLRQLLEALGPQERESAFSPKPGVQPLTDILLDAWSLTSIHKMPGRPEVAAYLHGLTYDAPETYVAWRKELPALHEHGAEERALRVWFAACRIDAREKLRDRADRVKKALAELVKAHRKEMPDRDFPVVLLDDRGEAKWSRMSEIIDHDFNLAYRTVVLPAEAGGLDAHGMLCAKATGPNGDIDVAEDGTSASPRERWLYIHSAGGERYERLLTGERVDTLPQGLREQERIVLKEQSEDVENAGEARDLLLMVSPQQSALENPETAKARQTLEEHTNAITTRMAEIAKALGLENSIQDALVRAARWHDRGKDRPVWQRYARNQGGTEPLAKSMKYLHPRALGGYRHEFGSLLEALADTQLQTHAERNLILHLIAAHHGWARPHFEPRSFDHTYTTDENAETAVEAMRRFGRLQERFGRWGLAWLESLLRCADIAASQQAAESATEPQMDEVLA